MAELMVGKKAPAFTLRNAEGGKVSLRNDLLGSWSVLYFYPKDNTPGCTKEACSFRDLWSILKRKKVKVYGVSPDSVESHERFTAKYDLPFPLLADPDHKVAEKYGAWGEKKMYGRTVIGIKRITFLIDPDGKIRHIFRKVDTARHAEQVLETLAEIEA